MRYISVVDGLSADLVVGMKERFGQQVAHVGAAQAVHDASAFAVAFDEAGEAKLGQMLARDGWPTAGYRAMIPVLLRAQRTVDRRLGRRRRLRRRLGARSVG
jgi:hypothetical protein